MTLILVRHGETAGNFARVVQVPETPLNETGLQQAERVAGRLLALRPLQLLTSDQPRARMTAEVIAEKLGLPYEPSPLLRERDLGDFRGRPYSDFTEFHPLAPDVEPPNGETWAAFHARVREAFALVLSRRAERDGPVLVVTHGLVLRSLFEHVVPPGALPVPAVFANTSVSILDAEPPHGARLINCTRHLDQLREGGAA